MIGFTFANIHSSELGVFSRSINRTMSPSLRENEFIIPGRHGTIDFGSNTYNKRIIEVEINLIKKNLKGLRQQAREVAQWLSKVGMLVFDDEPDKAYQAKIYSQIDIEQIATRGISVIVFECQPFAESLEYRQVNIPSITTKPYELPLNVKGTSETCCIITIKNIGETDIKNITIRRKAAI